MNTPYRDAIPVADDDEIPDFGNRTRLGRAIAGVTLRLSGLALVVAFERTAEAAVLCAGLYAFLLVWTVALLVLEPRMRAWLAARRARAVIEGVATLEAKASALSARK